MPARRSGTPLLPMFVVIPTFRGGWLVWLTLTLMGRAR
jgi:hypothetical protein